MPFWGKRSSCGWGKFRRARAGKNGLGCFHVAIYFKSRRHRFASDPGIPSAHFQKAIQHILFRDAEAQTEVGLKTGIDELVSPAVHG